MKPHTLHRLYKAIMFVVLTGIVVFVYRTNPDFLKAPKVESAASQNVSGFAWSGGADSNDGIGWISFNDLSDGSATQYGVNIDTSTGDFSGTAWSEHIGWISFERSATNNPPQNDPGAGAGAIARVNKTTGVVAGWARAIAGCEDVADTPVLSCARSNAGFATGGWDGWIKLSAEPADAVQYGVSISSTGQFSGYAWGGDILGWISFSGNADNGSPYGVNANFTACTISNVIPSGGSWGSCVEVAGFCSSNSPGTPIPRTRTGVCGFGYNPGTVVDFSSCTSNSFCLLTTTPNNGICEPGETLLNAPSDCKGKVKQF